jgi:hypothetical protein
MTRETRREEKAFFAPSYSGLIVARRGAKETKKSKDRPEMVGMVAGQ